MTSSFLIVSVHTASPFEKETPFFAHFRGRKTVHGYRTLISEDSDSAEAMAERSIELSEEVLKRNPEIESFEEMTDAEIVQYFLKIRGVGSWSAEYLLLRSLGSLIYFLTITSAPGETSKNMWVLRKGLTKRKLKRSPYGASLMPGYVYFHFLLYKLRTKGCLP